MKASITNWGLYPKHECEILEPENYSALAKAIENSGHLIARGNGRCYGDASLAKNVLSTVRLNQIIEFDEVNGTINCQSGVLFSAILEKVVPHGFFLPITPGTKFITVGGAFASDIHGKNHHVDGVFSDHVLTLKLMDGSGTIRNLNPAEELFKQTAGGMGLTGVILELKFKLKKIETSFIRQTSIRARNLEDIFRLFEENKYYTYSVAWIDCLARGKDIGRSVLMLGEHATKEQVSNRNKLAIHAKPLLNVPVYLPSWFLNSFFIQLFNSVYYHKPTSSRRNTIVHYDPFFYPLDSIYNWNKIYGRKGFIQYQFVIPKEKSFEGVKQILGILSENRLGSFLAVLKLFGKSHDNRYLHFPIEGYTLALDIKIENRIWSILDQIDEIVTALGGKVYLTKDARLSQKIFYQQYPQRLEAAGKFSSFQMTRLNQQHTEVILILGANSDIAREATHLYIRQNPGCYLLLASRNTDALKDFVATNQYEANATVLYYDAEDIRGARNFVASLPEKPSVILYAAGVLEDNKTCFEQNELWLRNANVNFTGAVAVLNACVNDENPFLRRIVGISSIAGLRGRRSNFLYGSAKAGLHQYLFGLRQELKSRGILVQALTPGFVKTKMTRSLPENKNANTARQVAEVLFTQRRSFELYPNFFWKIIARLVRILPERIIARL